MIPNMMYVLTDIYRYFMAGDILNLTRHTTIAGPYYGGTLKALATCYTAKEANELIEELSRDYALYNRLPQSYQDIVQKWIDNSKKYCEQIWIVVVLFAIMTYPLVNLFLNIKASFIDENPQRFMIHEVNILFVERENQFESPVFEMYYIYCLYTAGWFILFYAGYDSLFGILVDHACLKITVYCKRFEDAIKIRDERSRIQKVTDVIKEQKRLFQYLELLQSNYNIYLGTMLFAALLQIGTCLYHVSESEDLDLPFLSIALGSICCVYIPCFYSSKLKHVSLESATSFYSSGWENVNCAKTRKILLFMIARAQVPLQILGFNFILYDMNLFVSILRSAYSIYALLCS
ncbi:odorant receptor 49b-like [Aricia agestis]|uniref:odorant receptor 49b-like n=1 Tax=Aricia agestis TaxID=91739 RepID=UPI001C204097|nr:odorant receptor 49b-like [Aricia agestis]